MTGHFSLPRSKLQLGFAFRVFILAVAVLLATPMDLTRRNLIALGFLAHGSLFSRAWALDRSVDEMGFVPIGGIDQWIAIQGGDAGNPAILYLHGGPGEAQSPFLKELSSMETGLYQ
jgi:hypothetical protein